MKLVENVGLISPHFHIYLDDNIYDKKVEHLEKILSCNYQGHIVSVKGGETAGKWSLDRISLDRNCHFSLDRKF